MKKNDLMEIINKNTDKAYISNQKNISKLYKELVDEMSEADEVELGAALVASDKAFHQVTIKIIEESLFGILIDLNLVELDED